MPVIFTRALVLVLFFVAVFALSDAQAAEQPSELPAGLELFLEARLLEASGAYGEAAERYAQAIELNPGSTEIRVRYASLLSDMSLAGRAVELLEGLEDLDWYGLRVRGLALAQLSARQPELLEEAEAALTAAVDERTDDPNLMLSLAQVIHRQGRPVDAEVIVRDLRASRGGSQQLVAYHAGLLREVGRIEESAELYGLCVNGFPIAEVCRQHRVDLLLELGRIGEAGEEMLAWLSDDDLDDLLRAAAMLSEGGRPDRALSAVRRVLAVEPDSTRARTLEALVLSNLGRGEEAAERFQDLLRKDHENLDLLMPLAWTLARDGEVEDARTYVNRAWELVQEDAGSAEAASVCLTAARVELASAHPLLARDWLDRVADPEVAGAEIIRLTAETYRRTEQWSDGVAAMLRMQPRLSSALRPEAVAFEAEFRLRGNDERGMSTLRPLMDSDQLAPVIIGIQVLQILERWEDVERETAAALERRPSSSPLLFARAAALERLGRFEESAAVFLELLEKEPRNAAAANYLAYMWADNSTRLHEALELIVMAVEQDPENPAYLDSLGWTHYRLGNLEEARHWLARAAGLGEPDSTVLGHLGEVLLQVGEVDDARRYLEQSLTLGGESAEHVKQLLDGIEGAN